MKKSGHIPAVVLNFLYTKDEWPAVKKHILESARQELAGHRGVQEISYRYNQLRFSLRKSIVYHTTFQPKLSSQKKLLLAAKAKLAALDLPAQLWQEAFFIVLPPWESPLEEALRDAIIDQKADINTIPSAIAIPAYVISPVSSESSFIIVGFKMERKCRFKKNGQWQTKIQYIQAQAKNIISA